LSSRAGDCCNLSGSRQSHKRIHLLPSQEPHITTLHSASNLRAGLSHYGFRSLFALGAVITFCAAFVVAISAAAQTPGVGSTAPDFTLSTPAGASVRLSQETAKGTTVLVVLRGFPGYQCPYCVRQAHDFIEHAADFEGRNANVLLVYPGPPAELDQRAKEFLVKQPELPSNIKLVIDPDYKMTDLYGLRWNAPHETAYPSTFILDRRLKILYEKISHSHGDRTTAQDILAQLAAN
jgi:thioredoxin-dependent peroxiredoxin